MASVKMNFNADEVQALMNHTASEELVGEYNLMEEYKKKAQKISAAKDAIITNVAAFIAKHLESTVIPDGVKMVSLPYYIEGDKFQVMSKGILVEYLFEGAPVTDEIKKVVASIDTALVDKGITKPVKGVLEGVLADTFKKTRLTTIRSLTAFAAGGLKDLNAAFVNTNADLFTQGLDSLPESTGTLNIVWRYDKERSETTVTNGEGKPKITTNTTGGWLDPDPVLGQAITVVKKGGGSATRGPRIPPPEGFKTWIAYCESMKGSDKIIDAMFKTYAGKVHGKGWSAGSYMRLKKHPVYKAQYDKIHPDNPL